MASSPVALFDLKVPFNLDYVELDQDFEAELAEVYDPSKFWIKIRFHDVLRLTEDLTQTYASYPIQFNKHLLKSGLTCMVKINEQFYRAIVHTYTPSQEMLIVFLIDMGLFQDIPTQNVFYMDIKDAQIPRLAIRARLHNLAPSKTPSWTIEDRELLKNILKGRKFIAKAIKIDEEFQILELEVRAYSCCAPVVKVVREVFEALGNAVTLEQFDALPHPSRNYWVDAYPFLHPTIERIEKGDYPATIEELGAVIPYIVQPLTSVKIKEEPKDQPTTSDKH